MMRTPTLAALLALCAACSATDSVSATIEGTTFAATLGVNLAASTKTASGLYYRDITVGSGAIVVAGQNVSVHYTGSLTNGTIFDANGTNATPFTFKLGAGQVIAGWDEGVAGMHVGGVRQLIIPPQLGYGGNAVGSIPANSILVFTVTVVSAS